MRKYCSFVLVLLICVLLCGCGIWVEDPDPATPQEAMIQLFMDEHKLHSLPATDFSVEYLGCFDDVHVGFINGGLNYTTAMEDDEIGGLVFHYTSSQKLQAYRGNELLELSEAYDSGWFTEEGITQVFEKYRERYPGLYVDYWMKVHYLEQFEKNGKYTVNDVRIESYGMCGDCRVAFVDTTDMAYLAVLTEENIAGYSFRYTSSRTLKVYKDGEYKSLQEAYDAGWFDTSSLGLFFVSYRDAHPSYYEEDNWA